jgi:DNA-binding IclR family transcriptional regulator
MSAVLKPYTPRPGSVAERAIEHLTAFGERSATDLAGALEVDTSTLMPCLSTAIRFGAAEQFKRDGRIWYRLGDGTPPAGNTPEGG